MEIRDVMVAGGPEPPLLPPPLDELDPPEPEPLAPAEPPPQEARNAVAANINAAGKIRFKSPILNT